ncbi:DUF2513 domain-containing protein [Chroococcidiopsis sp. CCNUC1]|jgi:Hypothetical protein (DUF2513)|uniref:DUF2513 domain-containing protein n=1 Tax=Chroococcidiopsis sp. CCNUC1 TaxID=2653189 RepID=UPI002021BB91|nr:DUF2513 domain-containing protein [Chroococcidiopsis sp. CCNUC1]URD53492.1 DUF2513 domain-containing protein [Chroococcidiopsis sp. CCNUC1]
MKRDMELVKKILIEIESQESGYAPTNMLIEGYAQEQIHYHSYLMIQAGLIEGIRCTNLSSTSPQAIPRSLTSAGHDFLDAARNEALWNKAMTIVQEKGGAITVAVLSQLLSSLMKNHFDLP